jgi:hypothetical protein
MLTKEQTAIAIKQGLESNKDLRFNLFNYDYFNQLVNRICKNTGFTLPLRFETEEQAKIFGAHIAYYENCTARIKEFPEVVFYPNYDSILINEKSELLFQ